MCDLGEGVKLGKFIGTLAVDGGGIFLTCLSILSLLINKNIDKSLREILISFQANSLIGSCILLHTTVSGVCNEGDLSSFRWTSSCMLLTLTHLMLLMVVEHTVLSSSVHKPLPSFSGLICVCWLTSTIMVGLWNATTTLMPNKGGIEVCRTLHYFS